MPRFLGAVDLPLNGPNEGFRDEFIAGTHVVLHGAGSDVGLCGDSADAEGIEAVADENGERGVGDVCSCMAEVVIARDVHSGCSFP